MKRSTPTSSAWTILIKNDSILCQEKNSREIVKFLISYATAEKQFKNVKNIPFKNRNCEFSKKKKNTNFNVVNFQSTKGVSKTSLRHKKDIKLHKMTFFCKRKSLSAP